MSVVGLRLMIRSLIVSTMRFVRFVLKDVILENQNGGSLKCLETVDGLSISLPEKAILELQNRNFLD